MSSIDNHIQNALDNFTKGIVGFKAFLQQEEQEKLQSLAKVSQLEDQMQEMAEGICPLPSGKYILQFQED